MTDDLTDYSQDDDDKDVRDQNHIEMDLINAGLLPDPSLPDHVPEKDSKVLSDYTNYLVFHYENIMHRLSEDLYKSNHRENELIILQKNMKHELLRTKAALLWIKDSYDLDDLADRVIMHVVGRDY